MPARHRRPGGAARSAIAEAGEIVRTADSPSIIAWSLCLLGQLQTIQGHLSKAMEAYDRVLRLADEVGDARVLTETGAARVRIGDLLLERNDAESAKRNLLEGIEVLLEWSRLGAETIRSLQATEPHDRLGTPEDVLAEAAQGVATGYVSLARVNQAQGGIRKAPRRFFRKPNN